MKLLELQKILRAADPAAVLVSQRVLERVIQEVNRLPNLLWTVPHRQSCVVDRQVLFRHVEQDTADFIRRERSVPIEPGPERIAPDVGHRVIGTLGPASILDHPGGKHRDDVRMLQPGGVLDFGAEPIEDLVEHRLP